MADFENDPLAAAFDEFRGDVAPYVHPGGTARIRETVRSRKRNRTIVLGAVAALVVAIPAAAYAAIGGDRHGPPRPAASSATPSASPSASDSPAPSPSVTSASSPTTKAPNGQIPLALLKNATLNLPPWLPSWRSGCPSGPQKFTDGSRYVAQSDHLWIDKVVYGDVDHDGAPETVARVLCEDEYSTYQVVAFDRDAHGKIRTLGRVAGSTLSATDFTPGAVTDICDLRIGADGSIQLQVLDFPVPFACSERQDVQARWVTKQWRTFAWNGSGFVQSAGPTSFPTNPYASDLSVTSSDLTMVHQTNGHYLGTMTVTVKNVGPAAIPYRMVTTTQYGMKLTGPASCSAVSNFNPGGTSTMGTTCTGATLAAGASRTITLKFDSPSRTTPDFLPDTVVSPASGYGDPVFDDNASEFQVRY
jgi:hypothetical protein